MPKNKPLAKILHFDSFGKRQEKYNRLENSSVNSVEWKELDLKEPYYFFVPKNFEAEERYMKGFSINNIFDKSSSGIKTHRDHFVIDSSQKKLNERMKIFYDKEIPDEEIMDKLKLKDNRDWQLNTARLGKLDNTKFSVIDYRPFEYKNIYYSKDVIDYAREDIMNNMIKEKNIGLISRRSVENSENWQQIFISDKIVDLNYLSAQSYFFPLYLYNTERETLLDEGIPEKTPNFDMEVIAKIEKKLGMKLAASFLGEQGKECKIGIETFSPEDLLDYIYAVLHSKSYRETYKEFLKIDFPRVPFDVTKQVFHNMVELGQELRSWHLLENEKLTPNNFITQYPQDGNNRVEKIKYVPNEASSLGEQREKFKMGIETGKVFINSTQYFDRVPKTVWEFYIGGYQPAQKWLNDRKGRILSYEDIVHYGKIILTLSETIRIMEEIEGVFEL